MRTIITVCILALYFVSCSQKTKVDLLVYNATIYTVDSSFAVAEAMAVKDGKIIEVGKTADLQNKYDAKEKLDARGKFIYPGFIDAHAHFVGYGTSLQRVDLVDTKSWDEVIERTKAFADKNPNGWLLGRGWDQNDWAVKEFPTNEKLNKLFPDRPVLLTRIDGHAAIANQKALDFAGIKEEDALTPMQGGEIGLIETPNPKLDLVEIKLSGVLIDNAVDLVTSKIPEGTDEQFKKALQAAEQNCFAVGLTTIDDCGLSYQSVEKIKKLQIKLRNF